MTNFAKRFHNFLEELLVNHKLISTIVTFGVTILGSLGLRVTASSGHITAAIVQVVGILALVVAYAFHLKHGPLPTAPPTTSSPTNDNVDPWLALLERTAGVFQTMLDQRHTGPAPGPDPPAGTSTSTAHPTASDHSAGASSAPTSTSSPAQSSSSSGAPTDTTVRQSSGDRPANPAATGHPAESSGAAASAAPTQAPAAADSPAVTDSAAPTVTAGTPKLDPAVATAESWTDAINRIEVQRRSNQITIQQAVERVKQVKTRFPSLPNVIVEMADATLEEAVNKPTG